MYWRNWRQKCSTLLFPIPKYGRGIELYALLKKEIPGLKYAGDQHFVDQLSLIEDNMFWLKEESKEYLVLMKTKKTLIM